jgi:Kyanoviridae DNA primase/helicase
MSEPQQPKVDEETLILSNLVGDKDFASKVAPHLKSDYFHEAAAKTVLELITKYMEVHIDPPTRETLHIELKNSHGLNETTFRDAKVLIDAMHKPAQEKHSRDWLIDMTEKFMKNRALYGALAKAATLLEEEKVEPGKAPRMLPTSIPDLLSEALSVGLDSHVGHDFVEDFEERFSFYHSPTQRIPFDIKRFNDITENGLPRKTLTAIIAGTNVGKTLLMCHQAAANLMAGYNVLYITLEMAEERIAERIDANLLDVSLSQVKEMNHDTFVKRVQRVKERTKGKLIIKEYPTASASTANFRSLLKELSIKKRFRPDIIYVDYINICASSRFKAGANVNSYTIIKAIAEELRGLAVEYNLPIVTATQTTRSGLHSSDVDMSDTAESIGLPYTVDLMYAVMTSDDLQRAGHMLVKQLKNRLSDVTRIPRFLIGVDRDKMRIFDVDEGAQDLDRPSAQRVISGSGQVAKTRLSDRFKGKFN